MKNQAYWAVALTPAGMQKMATRQTAQPKYPYSIQGRALPILLCVLSIRDPKKMSLTPSKSLETAIRVPTTPAFMPTVSVRKIMTKALSRA